MFKQTQQTLKENTTASFSKSDIEKIASSNPEFAQTLTKYQSRIQKLERENKKLTNHIDECYDYIEMLQDIVNKNKNTNQKQENIRYAPTSSNRKAIIPKSVLEGTLFVALLLYALYIFL
jgi:predicted RNase H-like nuclease (RuvC/YqgF family)